MKNGMLNGAQSATAPGCARRPAFPALARSGRGKAAQVAKPRARDASGSTWPTAGSSEVVDSPRLRELTVKRLSQVTHKIALKPVAIKQR